MGWEGYRIVYRYNERKTRDRPVFDKKRKAKEEKSLFVEREKHKSK
jgi:hypothetical protein